MTDCVGDDIPGDNALRIGLPAGWRGNNHFICFSTKVLTLWVILSSLKN
jgi:hypothetical protein